MRITYTKGGLEESDFDQYGGDPMKAWADWFAQATEGKVRHLRRGCAVVWFQQCAIDVWVLCGWDLLENGLRINPA
jgi:hypothetical protein